MTASPLPSLTETDPVPLLRGTLQAADRALIFAGMLLLLEVAKFLTVGNTEAVDLTGAGNPVARALWYPLYFGLILALGARISALLRVLVPAWPIFALLGVTAASQIWSVAPEVTSRRVVAVTFTALFGIYLALREDRLDTLRTAGAAMLAAALFNLGTVMVRPGVGIDHVDHIGAWKGIMVEKNALGGEMARAGLVLAWLAHADRRWRTLWMAGFAVAVLLVLGSTSRTALLALALPMAAFALYLLGRRSPVAALGVFYLAVTAAGAAALYVWLAPEQAVGLIGKDLTFTGRTGIWDACMTKILEVPWTGYGFGAFWVEPYGPSYDVRVQVEWIVPSAHNSWIETGLALGFPGMVLLGVLVVLALARSGLAVLGGATPWIFLGLMQLTLFSMSESLIFWHPNTFSCTLFAFYATLALMPAARRQKKPGA
ncbi:MAG: O-antigen ligase family protein [Hyphomonas sp.]|uniref:O-antigen ligase family protein n=1 Tax=Hyphomonas sp. TaxID=87 RepID=UPI0017D571D5|nr:O-antigen ligase family protein [Hyphomonas sp.]MBA3067340.1 O-antigen ligase family protein [Hyphomonas sp.]MBU4063029.1 O-antigen ligase family protein [Alphaproteobacteria bacterium]